MKRLSLFLGMALAASLSLTNCTEKIEGPIAPATPAGIPFEISADISTKTTNHGLATKWAEGDAINLFHAVTGTTDYVSDKDFTLDATRVGVFTGNLTSALAPSTSYDWYAIYPYNQALETPANNATTAKYFYVGGRSDTPAVQNGNNSTSHLVERYAPLWGKAANVPSNEKPSMIMQHLASVVKVKVTNTTEKPLTVNSVAFTSTEPIVGQFYIDVTGTAVEYTTGDGLFNSSTASLTVKGATPLAKGESAVYYIPIKPHTAAKDKVLKISVNGYEKPLTLPKDVTFTAGSIKPLAFNYDNTSDVSQATFDFSSKESIESMGIAVPATSTGTEISSKTFTVGAVSMTSTDGGTPTRIWNSNGSYDLRVYAKGKTQNDGSITFKVPAGYLITKVVFNGTAPLSVTEGSYTDNVWKGSTQSVTFTATNTCKITAVDVFYEVGEVKPLISATDITGISARGESAGELVYTIENQVEGTTLSGSYDGIVVTSVIDNGDGKTFLYEVSKNLGVAREGWIKLTYGDVEKTIKVSQNAPVFTVSRTEVELKADNSASATITITSDFGWTATTSEGAGIRIDPESYKEGSNADGKTTMTIVALEANTLEGIKNLGNITITNNDIEQTLSVNVTQLSSYQPPFINLSSEAVKVAADATSASFTVESNVEYKVHTDAAWIGLYDEKKTSNGTVTILFEANTESKERTAVITVSSTDNTISKTFTLTQSGAGAVVTDYSAVYTSNLKFNADKKVTIGETEYDAAQVGSTKKPGSLIFKIPAGTKRLCLHVVGWSDEGGKTHTIATSVGKISSSSITTTADTGATGNGPFTLSKTDYSGKEYYFEFTLTNVTEESTITIKNSAKKSRGVYFGINVE